MSAAGPIRRIAAAGAGRMGRGIAQVFAYAGYRVDLVDLKPRAPQAARALGAAALAEVGANLAFLRELGVLDAAQRTAILARIRFVAADEAPQALASADCVFEGVTETVEAKREALAEIGRRVRPDALVASTTSTILADTLAAFVPDPARFLNTHFLNPAFLMPLVEIMPASAASEAAYARMAALLESAGKVCVRCGQRPGYIVPRIQAAAMNEAARIVEEGAATPADVDRAVRAGFGPRYASMGLAEFIDFGGLDILYYASSYLMRALGAERFRPPAIIEAKMKAGERGLRDGVGLYDHRGRDVAAYTREVLARQVDLFRHMGLLPAPGPERGAAQARSEVP